MSIAVDSVKLSDLIREVSLFSGRQLLQKLTISQCTDNSYLCRVQTILGHLYNILPPKTQRPLWKGEQKDCKIQRQGRAEAAVSSRHVRTTVLKNSNNWGCLHEIHIRSGDSA